MCIKRLICSLFGHQWADYYRDLPYKDGGYGTVRECDRCELNETLVRRNKREPKQLYSAVHHDRCNYGKPLSKQEWKAEANRAKRGK